MSHFKKALQIQKLKEEVEQLQSELKLTKQLLDAEKNKLSIAKYRSEKEDIIHLKLEKKYEKLNEQYGKLEIENLSLRETLKVIL